MITASTEARTRTGTPVRAADFESAARDERRTFKPFLPFQIDQGFQAKPVQLLSFRTLSDTLIGGAS